MSETAFQYVQQIEQVVLWVKIQIRGETMMTDGNLNILSLHFNTLSARCATAGLLIHKTLKLRETYRQAAKNNCSGGTSLH